MSLSAQLSVLPSPLHALIVAGTAGIGLGVAQQLSSALPNAHINIAGRNVKVASQICSDAPNHNIHNKRLDASPMTDIRRFCSEFREELSTTTSSEPNNHLDMLVMTQGLLAFKWTLTSEGIDPTTSLNYYGRMFLIRELIIYEYSLTRSDHGVGP